MKKNKHPVVNLAYIQVSQRCPVDHSDGTVNQFYTEILNGRAIIHPARQDET